MRNRHRLAVVVSCSLFGAALTLAACSGDDGDTSGLFDAGPDTAANTDGTTAEDGGTTSDTGDTGSQQDTSTQDVVKIDATTRDTGVPNVVDGGPDSGGIPCVVGGTLESEPNNDANQANTLVGTVCGTIIPTALDVTDFFKFKLQPATKTMTIFFSGNVKVTVKVPGEAPVVLTPQSSPAVPFSDKEYSLQVESNETVPTNRQNYTLTVDEK